MINRLGVATLDVSLRGLGKLKTVSQMVAIPFLLYDARLFGLIDTQLWGTWLIYLAAVLTTFHDDRRSRAMAAMRASRALPIRGSNPPAAAQRTTGRAGGERRS